MTVRSARTMSKLPEWRFGNALAMVTFFKRTFEQSFQDLENETSTAALFNRVYKLMYDFSQVMYAGSTNAGQESAYASFVKPGGSTSNFDDVVLIVVDETINTTARVKDGELRANYYFMAPTPAERILVGVGLIYTVA
jgi:phage tail sheath protein FI